ncbi:MAG: hypothetical protein JOZ74_18665 [Bradyrhizobium sp.]|nr:hypothetical protein [Bradyrhizobium sp.]
MKLYGASSESAQGRYSPAECTVRAKLGLRATSIRSTFPRLMRSARTSPCAAFTRLTNAFSEKFENHMHLVALYTFCYNYVNQHKSLKGISPAMAIGLRKTLWSMTDLAEMIDATLLRPGKRGPYKVKENSN